MAVSSKPKPKPSPVKTAKTPEAEMHYSRFTIYTKMGYEMTAVDLGEWLNDYVLDGWQNEPGGYVIVDESNDSTEAEYREAWYKA